MSDLLSAASLFLAVIGLLYSVWYNEITVAMKLTTPKHRDDRKPFIRKIKNAYHTRALPLAAASVTLAVILAPDLIVNAELAFRYFVSDGLSAFKLFDAVRSLFCAIAITSIGLAVHTVLLARKVRKHWKEISK